MSSKLVKFFESTLFGSRVVALKENDIPMATAKYTVNGRTVSIDEISALNESSETKIVEYIIRKYPSVRVKASKVIFESVDKICFNKFLTEGKEEYVLQNSNIVKKFLVRILNDRNLAPLNDRDLPQKIFDGKTDEELRNIAIKQLQGWTEKYPYIKKYLVWVFKQYVDMNFREEDLSKLNGELERFGKFQSQLKKKDLNSYTYTEFAELALELAEKKTSNEEKNEDKSGAVKEFENSEWVIIHPTTKEAAIYYGKGTRWCTAATGSYNYFDHYNSDGGLYILINKQNPEQKWQVHFQSNSYMNPLDRHDSDKLESIVSGNDDLYNAFLRIKERELNCKLEATALLNCYDDEVEIPEVDNDGNITITATFDNLHEWYDDNARDACSWSFVESFLNGEEPLEDFYFDYSYSLSEVPNSMMSSTIDKFISSLKEVGLKIPESILKREEKFLENLFSGRDELLEPLHNALEETEEDCSWTMFMRDANIYGMVHEWEKFVIGNVEDFCNSGNFAITDFALNLENEYISFKTKADYLIPKEGGKVKLFVRDDYDDFNKRIETLFDIFICRSTGSDDGFAVDNDRDFYDVDTDYLTSEFEHESIPIYINYLKQHPEIIEEQNKSFSNWEELTKDVE